ACCFLFGFGFACAAAAATVVTRVCAGDEVPRSRVAYQTAAMTARTRSSSTRSHGHSSRSGGGSGGSGGGGPAISSVGADGSVVRCRIAIGRRTYPDDRPVTLALVAATIMDGAALAARIRIEVAREVAELGSVGLATVLVGEDPASEIYI